MADLVVLAGGAATRLAGLQGSCPKPLLPVGGVPFMVHALQAMGRTARVRRIILTVRAGCAIHFNEFISKSNYPIVITEETHPFGTGGAILDALAVEGLSDPFLVINGDVLFDMDAAALLAAARQSGAAMAGIEVPDTVRFGRIETHREGYVTGFAEKDGRAVPGLINAGAYAFTRESLAGFERGPCSFEYDIAPVLAGQGRLALVRAAGPFLDIGTPETWQQAGAFVQAWPPTMQVAEQAG